MLRTIWSSIPTAIALASAALAQARDTGALLRELEHTWNWNIARDLVERSTHRELLAALNNNSPLLEEPVWTKLAGLIEKQRDKLVKLWLDEPELRAHSGRLFSMLDIDWAGVRSQASKRRRSNDNRD